MKRLSLLFCCTALLGSSAVCQAVTLGDFYQAPKLPPQTVLSARESVPPWLALWQEARRLARAGDLPGALQQYELFLASKKDVVQPRWEMASILLARHEFERAAALLEMLLEEFPDQVDYLNGLGYAMQETGRFDRAAELFEQAEEFAPGNIITLTGMSESLLSLGQVSDAMPYLEQLYARRPDDAGLAEQLVGVYEQLGLYERARPLALQLADRKNPTIANLRAAARICSALEEDELAERYWSLLLDKAPLEQNARAWLAAHLEEKGDCQAALPHLLFLLERDRENPDILVRTGGCYLKIREPARALPYYEKYLKYFPHDKEISAQLVNIHAALGDDAGTLAAVDRYFQLEPQPSLSNLRRAARLYDGAGRYHDAIPIYRRLLERAPDDREILGALARDLLAVDRDEEALQVLAHLATVSPDSKTVYQQMLDLLLGLDHPGQLHHVLVQLHQLDPEEPEVTLRLAASFLAAGEISRAEEVFHHVVARDLKDTELLVMRAQIFEALHMADHARGDYEAALQSNEQRRDLQLKALQLAASLGKLTEARRHYKNLENTPLAPPERLAVANAFRDGCDFDGAYAIYRDMIADPGLDRGLRCRAFMELAESCELQGLFYEAEQALRFAFITDAAQQTEVLARLADLQLAGKLSAEAGVWLAQLRALMPPAGQNGGDASRDFLPGLLQIRQLNLDGKYAAAMRKAVALRDEIRTRKATESYRGAPAAELVALELIRAYQGMQEFAEAERECQTLLAGQPFDFPALLLLKKMYAEQGNMEAAAGLDKRIMALAGQDLGRMLRLARLSQETGDIDQLTRAAEAARQMAPDSCRASFFLARAYSSSGQLVQARDLINALQRDYPENQAIQTLAARVAFIMGFNQEALSYCDAVLARYPDRADMELLKARVYWRRLDWQDSFAIYEDYLTPAVNDLLVQQSAAAGLELPREPKPTIWQRLTFSRPGRGSFTDQVMSPVFLATSGRQDVNQVAVPLYSRYMWQQRFAAEMAARRLVEQRDDFQAVNQFTQLVEKYPDDESLLFDLAGIYSRMGKLGEEALLYQRLAGIDPGYPGLAEASERNRLKRLPRVDLSYHYREENGWDGYKALRRDSVDFGSWASLKPGADLDLSLSRIRYSDVDSDDEIDANRAVIAYDATLFDRLGLRLGGGLETADGEFDDAEIIECGLTGKVSDRIQGEFTYVRDVVADTLASLSRSIVSENYKGGLFLGILPRLITGGDYGYTNYSDGNEVKGYSIWASYIIVPEPTYLQFKFTYEFLDARETGDRGGALLADGFTAFDHPYWAPSNYWKNSYNILWKHKLSADTLERGTPSYYSTEFMLDYDSQGHVIQTVKGGFSLELTRNFMLESALRLVNSDEYRDRDFILSAIYRW
ncbi:MAG: hypothetical protein C4531_14065 [Desulfurivibrio sp.]|nr:MAG: hypothetical protein C4531_14065 [Desulfurivibrio sp.]